MLVSGLVQGSACRVDGRGGIAFDVVGVPGEVAFEAGP